MTLPPTQTLFGEPKPRFWPGLLLTLLLPGSGFSYLGRPWQHLGALLLTLLTWLLAWLLVLYTEYSGLSSQTAFPPPLALGLEILAALMAAGVYGVLGWSYVVSWRRGAGQPVAWWRWPPILLHALLLLLGVWWALVKLNPPY